MATMGRTRTQTKPRHPNRGGPVVCFRDEEYLQGFRLFLYAVRATVDNLTWLQLPSTWPEWLHPERPHSCLTVPNVIHI